MGRLHMGRSPMASLNRPIPGGLTRFNYWKKASIHPRSAVDLSFDADYGSEHLREEFGRRFQKHRTGPCNIRGCGTDALFRNASPEEWDRLALEELAATDSAWNNVEGATALYNTLDADAQERIRAAWNQRRRAWAALLGNIARDQLAYDQITRSSPKVQELERVGERFGRSESWARQVYARYSEQAMVLRGAGVLVQSPESRRVWKDRGGLRVEGRRVMTAPYIPEAVIKGRKGQERRAIEDRWIEHWFAHALRNLVRYRDKHGPLAWPGRPSSPGASSDCRETCLRERDRRANAT
jgi:hypothetical protein